MKRYDEQMLLYFAMYHRTVDLMKATGLSKPTIIKYKKDEAFMDEVGKRRKEMLESALSRMECELLNTVNTLCEIRDNASTNAQIRVSACNAILNHYQNYKISLDLIDRVEALEKKSEDNY